MPSSSPDPLALRQTKALERIAAALERLAVAAMPAAEIADGIQRRGRSNAPIVGEPTESEADRIRRLRR